MWCANSREWIGRGNCVSEFLNYFVLWRTTCTARSSTAVVFLDVSRTQRRPPAKARAAPTNSSRPRVAAEEFRSAISSSGGDGSNRHLYMAYKIGTIIYYNIVYGRQKCRRCWWVVSSLQADGLHFRINCNVNNNINECWL